MDWISTRGERYSQCLLVHGACSILQVIKHKGKEDLLPFMIFRTKGEVVCLAITPGNVNDRKSILRSYSPFIEDKKYLSKRLSQELFKKGAAFITKIKRNMKN